ncbi:hypothetical protein PUNSTDRAFT_114229 [Punctularia strigosozonata HHB-11173 SS5]|uniref:uncharacterized protein n=1 Tax=Punctularia strigosozonata (strain HHB-11173) TaxID=741275 RepID=UPI0004416DE3|nr:uncharacterized protein PUNSTDRAFT_114229 [Punctularia strigosozonata HHB-11173 SS5]EIN07760.1 hypothetical protein PUNSTDRAFT_114229 [Punctularia strigosozonata HHB-11173 SS5]
MSFLTKVCSTTVAAAALRSVRYLSSQPNTTTFRDFTLARDVFTAEEQKALLAASLQKLDTMDPPSLRRKRKRFISLAQPPDIAERDITDIFAPDIYYPFEEGHFDRVIRRYREMHVSSWPEADALGVTPLLTRLRTLFPMSDTQMHLLHLASDGEILPHVDNVEASGSWILGVSLGSTRTLRLERVDDPSDAYQVALPSGSVYLQGPHVRYRYNHAILPMIFGEGTRSSHGQRMSIMIRELF